jgi:hypothetical protein
MTEFQESIKPPYQKQKVTKSLLNQYFETNKSAKVCLPSYSYKVTEHALTLNLKHYSDLNWEITVLPQMPKEKAIPRSQKNEWRIISEFSKKKLNLYFLFTRIKIVFETLHL